MSVSSIVTLVFFAIGGVYLITLGVFALIKKVKHAKRVKSECDEFDKSEK